jgi:hypothetical protein
MDVFMHGFLLVWIGLLGAPVLAVVIFVLSRRRPFQPQSVVFAGSVLLLYFGVACSGLSFVAVQVNLIFFVVAYFAYSFLAVMCLRIPTKAVRILTFVIAIIPIGFGFILSTIGVLGLAFIVGDYTSPPERVEQMAMGLTCRVRGWGSAGSASGYAVELYQSWNEIPFVERKVLGNSVVQDGYSGPPPKDVSCGDLFAKYEKASVTN